MTHLIVKAVPVLPKPSNAMIREIETMCPEAQCPHLHEWLARLLVFKDQLHIYEQNLMEP